MATFSDYLVLTDDYTFSLPRFNDDQFLREQSMNFNPPNDIVLNGTGHDRPVLSYMLDPSSDAKNLRVDVYIREKTGADQKISSWNLSGGTLRTVSEPFHHEKLSTGNNKIIFKVPSESDGTVKISNVVVWYKRKN